MRNQEPEWSGGGESSRPSRANEKVTETSLPDAKNRSLTEMDTSGKEQLVSKDAADTEESALDSGSEINSFWLSESRVMCCVNTYPNGITFSLHSNDPAPMLAAVTEQTPQAPRGKFVAQQFHLRLPDTRDYRLPEGKYFLYREEFQKALERQLSALNKRNVLSSMVCYFGVTGDPFFSFQKKFDVTTGCLEILQQYRPGQLIIQTRSPMVIAVLPMLKALGSQALVVIPVETPVERAVARYTPGQPRIAERLVTAQGLRRQGVRVCLSVSPILPYGDYYRDAATFAELLDQHADFITFGCLASGTENEEKDLRALPIARKLAADRQYRWLRPRAYRYLQHAVSMLAPAKLKLPASESNKPTQLTLFAA